MQKPPPKRGFWVCDTVCASEQRCDMEAWVIALLVKGVTLIALAFAYYVVVYKGSHLIGRFLPNGKLKEFLFRERGSAGASPSRELD